MKYFHLLLLALLTGSLVCKAQPQVTVKSNNPSLHYMGRIVMTDTSATLSWSASSVSMNFEGAGVSAVLKDERADNNYNVIVDGKVLKVIHPEKNKRNYELVSGLAPGKHTIELFKRTEWAMGKTWFYGFGLDRTSKILPVRAPKKRKIEYFGDSITCGYADEDSTGQDRGTAEFENGYLAYSAITARHYNAEFHNTSKSGIGVMVSWFSLIMPEMYDRLDATDSLSKWDFSKYMPDLVIVNLLQNDSWIVQQKDNPQFKARFGGAAPTAEFITRSYQEFVMSVRAKYPKAQIVCILGSMDASKAGSPWPGYVEKAVTGLNDSRIHAHTIPYKKTNGHPSTKEQQAMADDLIAYLDGNIKW